MSASSGSVSSGTSQRAAEGSARGVKGTLFDLDGIDLSGRTLSKQDLERWNPHRGEMALLDWIVWENEAHTQGIALKHVRPDEFWVPGHFPDRPMFPGVLMIEAGAQLACYLYNVRQTDPGMVAFLRIENAVFRASVEPGDDLYLLCQEIKVSRRRFISDVQGLVGNRVTFEARISGMTL